MAGVPTPPVLLACADGQVVGGAPRAALDRDLCSKPRQGRGARGFVVFLRIAAERYRAKDGETLNLDALIERLREQGRATPLIVQPRLENHAEIADLAEEAR